MEDNEYSENKKYKCAICKQWTTFIETSMDVPVLQTKGTHLYLCNNCLTVYTEKVFEEVIEKQSNITQYILDVDEYWEETCPNCGENDWYQDWITGQGDEDDTPVWECDNCGWPFHHKKE